MRFPVFISSSPFPIFLPLTLNRFPSRIIMIMIKNKYILSYEKETHDGQSHFETI